MMGSTTRQKWNASSPPKNPAASRKQTLRLQLYLYGRVDYSDAFGVNRWTTSRTVSTYVGGQPGFTGCAEGNDYF